jgi:hypothetical protein
MIYPPHGLSINFIFEAVYAACLKMTLIYFIATRDELLLNRSLDDWHKIQEMEHCRFPISNRLEAVSNAKLELWARGGYSHFDGRVLLGVEMCIIRWNTSGFQLVETGLVAEWFFGESYCRRIVCTPNLSEVSISLEA